MHGKGLDSVEEETHIEDVPTSEKLAKKRAAAACVMPGLAETPETDITHANNASDVTLARDITANDVTPADVTPAAQDGPTSSADSAPPVEDLEEGDPAAAPFPTLQDGALEKLGVLQGAESDAAEGVTNGATAAIDTDIEDKFAQLSLAFRTDRHTLAPRLTLHERARARAEASVSSELTALRQALATLAGLCPDTNAARDLFSRIREHVGVLEQATDRVSSRSEVHGAVQQESRLQRAVDVMLLHVENLKRLYEREHTELEDTRRMMNENVPVEGGSEGTKRYSLAGLSTTKLSVARRASVATFQRRASNLPRASKSSCSLDSLDVKGEGARAGRVAEMRGAESTESEDSGTEAATGGGAASSGEPGGEEMAYHRGFEEGMRAQVSAHLAELSEQQRGLAETLDDLIERNTLEEDETVANEGMYERLRDLLPHIEVTGKHLRYTVGGIVFFIGVLSLLVTLLASPAQSSRLGAAPRAWLRLLYPLQGAPRPDYPLI